jgi:putative glutamine amidotransferase
VGHDAHKQVPGEFAEHPVEIKGGSRLASIVGESSEVTSHHHQALGRVGEGLVETAWASDGTLEAVEDPTMRFTVGVQWHPEAGEDAGLFEALVDEARQYRAARGQTRRV